MARRPTLGRILPFAILAGLLLVGLVPTAGAVRATPAAAPSLPAPASPSTLKSTGATESSASASVPRAASTAVEATKTPKSRAPNAIFPPNPHEAARTSGSPSVTPSITTTPAAMGVSDLGIGTSGAAYSYETTSFRGVAQINSLGVFTAANASNPLEGAPNWLSLQLNTVAVNVSTLGHGPAGTFWIQNGLRFNGTSLQLEDNVWNFSNPVFSMPYSTMYGKIGVILPTLEGGNYYTGLGPTYAITLPLTVQLYTNITSTTGGHTVATVSYYLAFGASHEKGQYDTLTFNGSAPAAPSEFEVNGFDVDPAGSEYDAEFVFGGNGAGTNANILYANGTLALSRFDSGTSAYVPIPSGYNFGPDSSESVYGLSEWYAGTTVHFEQGPSFLAGLWNTTSRSFATHAAPGWVRVHLTVTPDYALVFATNRTKADGTLAAADYSYAPTAQSGSLSTLLPPPPGGEPYVFGAWAAGYLNATVTVSGNSSVATPLTLVASSTSFEAPVYLFGADQATAFATSGLTGLRYVASEGKLWLNGTTDALAAPFLRVNDADSPTFELFVTHAVNLSIALDAAVQGSSSFTYTDPTGASTTIGGWTQGYFFYDGHGAFSVDNTTIEGAATTDYELLQPPSTIEFYGTTGSTARFITVLDDAVGVSALYAKDVTIDNVTATAGAIGVETDFSSGLTVSEVTSGGKGPTGSPSWIAQLNRTDTIAARQFIASGSSNGLWARDSSGLTLTTLGAYKGAIALNLTDTNDSSISDLTVAGTPESTAGGWTFSSHGTLDGITIDGAYGVALTNDSSFTVEDGKAMGVDSAVVVALNGSTESTIEHLNADDGAAGVLVTAASFITLSSIYAGNGSVGVFLRHANNITGSDLTGHNLSIAIAANESTTSTFSSVRSSDASAAALVQNSTYFTFSTVTAWNRTLSTIPNFANVSSTSVHPLAALAFLHDRHMTVTGLSVTRYPYGVWSAWSRHVALTSESDWYSDYAIWANSTNASQFRQIFAFSDGLAVLESNCTETNVTLSTLEYAAKWGLQMVDDSNALVESNNFVGNNGSSVTGTFKSTNDQANLSGGTPATVTFLDNYWSDHSGAGAYVVNTTVPVKDRTPSTEFYSTYLEFNEHGLAPGTAWTVGFGGENYTVNASLFYVPGWSLSTGALPFDVLPVGTQVADPSAGSVQWTGASATVTIDFGAKAASPLSVPLWVYGAAGGGAAAVLVGVLIARRRRTRPREPENPFQPRLGATSPSGRDQNWSPDDRP